MAQDVSDKKSPRPKSLVADGNGAPTSSRIVTTEKRGSFFGLWTWLILGILIVAAGAVYFYLNPNASSATASGSKHGGAGDKIRVIGATAAKGNIGVYLTGLGSVTPLNTVTVRARVDGQLMQVLFTEGQMVKEGQQLVQIDDRPYQAQLAQYTAQKEHDQALLDNAKIDLDRYQKLWSQDSIPQQTLATQAALVKQDQGTVDSDQALIQTAQLNVDYCHITAPISGRVGLRLIDQGNQVHASDTNGLLVITQVQPITVLFTIPEDSIQPVLVKLHSGQQLAVDAYDRDMKKKLATGTLLTVDNQIDQTTGTLKLKALFQNTDETLFPNQFVNVRLLVEMKQGVILVPVAAIQHGTQGTFIYIVDTDTNTVKMQNVTVGTQDGDQAEITKGVEEGQTLVIDGVDKLQNDSKVILQSAADSKSVQGGSDGKQDSPHKKS